MQKYGDLFGPNPPQSLEELVEQMQQGIAAMQSLLDSLPADMRRQLQDLLMDKIGDPDLQRELQELAINLDIMAPGRDGQNQYPFRGDEEQDFLEILEQAGYIRRKGNQWELTPRGVKKIGEKALGEIYAQLKNSDYGKHPQRDKGRGGERADDTKAYEFGDPFHLNLGEPI